MAKIKVSAPGKIILSGEHAVVYGYPAILAAVDRRLLVEAEENKNGLEVFPAEAESFVRFALAKIGESLGEKPGEKIKIKISSRIPIGCGMGSSAALAVAVTGAVLGCLGMPQNLKRINGIAFEIEKKQHNTPSGGDNTVSAYGGFLLYRKETESFKVFSSLKTKVFPQIFLINSGKPEESTGEMVRVVKDFVLKAPQEAEKVFKEMEQITRNFLRFLSGEEQNFGDLIAKNERLLEQLGVVSSKTKLLIQKIESLGGSAKISGAGGVRGNSGIILAYHQDPKVLLKLANEEKLDMFKVKLGEKGIKNEQS